MGNWNTYTVEQLKTELKSRKLVLKGKKADLIARLEEADAEAAIPEKGEASDADAENAEELEASSGMNAVIHGKLQIEVTNNETSNVDIIPPSNNVTTAPIEDAQTQSKMDSPLPGQAPEALIEDGATEPAPAQAPEDAHGEALSSAIADDVQPEQAENTLKPPSEANKDTQIRRPSIETAEAEMMRQPLTQTNTLTVETVEDSRKRKRRSQSPPPSTHDASMKRCKAGIGSPRVKLPEDHSSAKHTELETQRDASRNTEQSASEDRKDTVMIEPSKLATNQDPKQAEDKMEVDTPLKDSSSDKRFKNLFSSTTNEPTSSNTETYADMPDRDVSPALHPATSTLYIRNFMRPLQATALKDHLRVLSRPPNSSSSDNEPIIEFFLDSIRTHCFARFTNISGASRVRTALHERVWPDEKNRKALWVDFVPEEKLEQWIEVEQGNGGTSGMKRWEVVYEKGAEGMMAVLQEVGASGGTGAGLKKGSTSGPVQQRMEAPNAAERPVAAPTAPRRDPGKGFKALDDLFKSTTAKPKLYYQPVSKAVAEKRLDLLDRGRGGGRNDEMRRFTFEDEIIVDGGAEFGANYRGGYRGRGGGGLSGGQSSRGGYRGDRGRDRWRDAR
jgi:hypothetical protein